MQSRTTPRNLVTNALYLLCTLGMSTQGTLDVSLQAGDQKKRETRGGSRLGP